MKTNTVLVVVSKENLKTLKYTTISKNISYFYCLHYVW